MFDWKKLRAVLSLCVALGWWGIWFPELAVWAEAVCVVEEDSESTAVQSGEKVVECETAREIYDGLLHADRKQIQVKSRLLQLVWKYFK